MDREGEPVPFVPAEGGDATLAAARPSVVGLPSASKATPGGKGSPVSAQATLRPTSTTGANVEDHRPVRRRKAEGDQATTRAPTNKCRIGSLGKKDSPNTNATCMQSRKDVIKYIVHSIDFWFERGEQYRRAMALVVMVLQRPFFVGSPGWVCGAPGFATSRRPRAPAHARADRHRGRWRQTSGRSTA